MLNTLFPPKQEAPAKTPSPNAVMKIQIAVSKEIKTLRHDISQYGVDLKATYEKDHKQEGRRRKTARPRAVNKGATGLPRGRRPEMTRTITTIQWAEPKGGVNRFVRRLGTALAALGDLPAAWSAPYYERGIGEEIEAVPPSKRLDAALRWHARHGRML